MRISKKTKSIISGILLVVIIAGVLALAGSLLGKETKTISSTEFSVGGINAQGNYVESKTSIYTKDMFECQGLSIEPDFEATGTYQVFYYDSNKNFFGATDELNAEDGVYNIGETFVFAKYARIVITPDVPLDEDGNVEENFKIRFYEVVGYAKDYKITVNKNQTYTVKNFIKGLENNGQILGEGVWNHSSGSFVSMSDYGFYIFAPVDTTGAKFVIMKVATSTLSNNIVIDGNSYDVFGISNPIDGQSYNADYFVIESNLDYSYVCFDVSAINSLYGSVDVNSVDDFELYLLN